MDTSEQVRLVIHAVRDPFKLVLLGAIAKDHPSFRRLSALCQELGRTPREIWPDLNKLRRAGMIQISDGDGDPRLAIDVSSLVAAADFTRSAGHQPPDDLDGFSDDERRVISTFVRDGKIDTFPAQVKKQLVLWRFLVRRFQPERDYTEPEVNDLLRPVNLDVATMRRALVDHGLMIRDAGIYRRTVTSPSSD